MAHKASYANEAVARYVSEEVIRESDLQKRLREETAKLPEARMQISPDQGAVLSLLVRLSGAKRVLEVGTFTGYSSLTMASALPDDGQLIACDVSEEWTAVAQRYWREAGLADRIELRIGPAMDTLDAMLADKSTPIFDFAFIDADKPGYDGYYEAALKLLRPGGLIVMDNMLAGGKVADPYTDHPTAAIMRRLNAKVRDDPRVEAALLTVGDGFMLARKR